METIAKYKGASGREIFFEADGRWPSVEGQFMNAKKYLNSVFLETGYFESYSFNSSFVTVASPDEKDMYLQLRDRSVYLIGK